MKQYCKYSIDALFHPSINKSFYMHSHTALFNMCSSILPLLTEALKAFIQNRDLLTPEYSLQKALCSLYDKEYGNTDGMVQPSIFRWIMFVFIAVKKWHQHWLGKPCHLSNANSRNRNNRTFINMTMNCTNLKTIWKGKLSFLVLNVS